MYRGEAAYFMGAFVSAILSAYLISIHEFLYAVILLMINLSFVIRMVDDKLLFISVRFSHALPMVVLLLFEELSRWLVILALIVVLFLTYSPLLKFTKNGRERITLRARIVSALLSLSMVMFYIKSLLINCVLLVIIVHGSICFLRDLKDIKKLRKRA